MSILAKHPKQNKIYISWKQYSNAVLSFFLCPGLPRPLQVCCNGAVYSVSLLNNHSVKKPLIVAYNDLLQMQADARYLVEQKYLKMYMVQMFKMKNSSICCRTIMIQLYSKKKKSTKLYVHAYAKIKGIKYDKAFRKMMNGRLVWRGPSRRRFTAQHIMMSFVANDYNW